MAQQQNDSFFLSYSRKDIGFAKRINDYMGTSYKIWFDQKIESMSPGEPFSDRIHQGITAAQHFVFLASPHSFASKWCNIELKLARELGKHIIFVVREEPDITVLAGVWIKHPDWENDAKQNYTHFQKINWLKILRKKDDPNCDCAKNFDGCDSATCDDDDFVKGMELLRYALSHNYDHIKIHEDLLREAKKWDEEDRNSSYLSRGKELENYEDWLDIAVDQHPAPTNLQMQYVRASREAETEQQLQAKQNRLWLARAVYTFLGILVIVIGTFLYLRNLAVDEANRQRDVAELEREQAQALSLANYAQQALQQNQGELALQLAFEAMTIENPPVQAQQVLIQSFYSPKLEYVSEASAIGNHAVAINDDNRLFAIGKENGTVEIWDVGNRTLIQLLSDEQSTRVVDIAFIESNQLASLTIDGELVIWDLVQSNAVRRVLISEITSQTTITSFAVHPTENWIAVGLSGDISMILLNYETGATMRTYLGATGAINDVIFHPDGNSIFAAGTSNTIYQWNIVESQQPENIFEGHDDWINALAIDSTGTRLVSGGRDGSLIIWQVAGASLERRLGGHEASIRDVEFRNTEQQVIALGDSNTVLVWNIITGQLTNVLSNSQVRLDGARSLEVAPNDEFAITTTDDGIWSKWDISASDVESYLEGPSEISGSPIFRLNVSGVRAVTTSPGRPVILWDLETQRDIRSISNGDDPAMPFGLFSQAMLSANGENLAIGTLSGDVAIWDVRLTSPNYGQVIRVLGEGTNRGHSQPINDIVFSLDNKYIATASDDQTIILWDIESGNEIQRFDGHNEIVTTVAFDSDTKYLVSGDVSGNIIIWDIASRSQILSFEADTTQIRDIEWSPTQSYFFVASTDVISSWDISGDLYRRYFGHTSSVNAIAFDNSGDRFISVSDDGFAILWDVEQAAIVHQYNQNFGRLLNVDFGLRNGNEFAVAGLSNGDLVFWSIPNIEDIMESYDLNEIGSLTCNQREQYSVFPLCETNN